MIETEVVHYRKLTLRDAEGRELIVTDQGRGRIRLTVPRPVEIEITELCELVCRCRVEFRPS